MELKSAFLTRKSTETNCCAKQRPNSRSSSCSTSRGGASKKLWSPRLLATSGSIQTKIYCVPINSVSNREGQWRWNLTQLTRLSSYSCQMKVSLPVNKYVKRLQLQLREKWVQSKSGTEKGYLTRRPSARASINPASTWETRVSKHLLAILLTRELGNQLLLMSQKRVATFRIANAWRKWQNVAAQFNQNVIARASPNSLLESSFHAHNHHQARSNLALPRHAERRSTRDNRASTKNT